MNRFPNINHLLANSLAIPFMRLYRNVLSPAFYMLGSRCIYYPSCGEYAEEAFQQHGFFRGLLLSSVRLAKCNPLFKGGFDPVPPAKHKDFSTDMADHIHTHDLRTCHHGKHNS